MDDCVVPIKAEYLLPPDANGNATTESGSTDGKRRRGVNRNRPRDQRLALQDKVCSFLLREQPCPYGDQCRYEHDIDAYWLRKPADLDGNCPLFEKYGVCRFGVSCRFAGQHVEPGSRRNVTVDKGVAEERELNQLQPTLRTQLLKHHYAYRTSQAAAAAVAVAPRPTADESPRLDLAGKLYLAPLTTLGNLPFRRLCVEFGAQVTCSEMTMAAELLKGNRSEWALVRRHPSEKVFGVQVCGSQTSTVARAAELLVDHAELDFLDLNAACPLDAVCERGAGCMLMKKHSRLTELVCAVQSAVGQLPLTVKLRTGVRRDRLLARDVVAVLRDLNVDMAMLHGRTRDQRYAKLADWSYVAQCAAHASPMPMFGVGDVLSYTDYYERLEKCGVAGVAIGRGALIKPWIFTEIAERRYWDISATERLDMLRRFVTYGLEHWGCDQEGVNRTRRFLLEWLSFLYRYVPIGLLERLPQSINHRPPRYRGREHLETLMASDRCSDWLRLSEMLLGPVPDGFQFEPKHRANAY